MKNAYVLLLIFSALSVCGQTEKGNSFISGSFSTRFETTLRKENYNSKWQSTAVGLGLQYGKFVKDNVLWEVSVNERITMSGNKIAGVNDNQYRQFNHYSQIGTSGAYFFGKNQWRGFVGGSIDASIEFSLDQTKINSNNLPNSKVKYSRVILNSSFKAGAIYFMDKHWALKAETSSNSFPISFAGVSLGLLYWVRPTLFRVEEATFSTLQKGNWTVGLDLGLLSAKQNKKNNLVNSYQQLNYQNEYRFGVKVGRFIKDRTVVGIRASIGKGKQGNNLLSVSSTETKAQLSGGIFVKRYLVNGRFTPFIETSLDFSRINSAQKGSTTNSTYHINTYQLGSSVGLAYLISNRFLVEAELADLTIQYYSPFNSQESLSVNLSSRLSPSFTLSYVF